jgi:hypothetical protein
MLLRQSTPQSEGLFRASKWLKHPILVDDTEMDSLFQYLGDFFIYNVSNPVSLKDSSVQKEVFLEKYEKYISALKSGEFPDESLVRTLFSCCFTANANPLYAMKISDEKFLVKPIRPVIQLQMHRFFISLIDGKFHSMSHSIDSISWGIQFSYPQLYQDPYTEEIVKVNQTEYFPNTALFSLLVKWIRNHTVATPFIYEGKQTNVSMRIGKNCFSWINQHPGLVAKNIKVRVNEDARNINS